MTLSVEELTKKIILETIYLEKPIEIQNDTDFVHDLTASYGDAD